MTKKLERTPLAISKTAGPRAVANVLAQPTKLAAAGVERVNVVLARDLRVAVERGLHDLDRRVLFSASVEAALREALAGAQAALVESSGARAGRKL